MADIFVSYKKEDAGRVIRIVEGLREEGFTVWWDHGIAPGSSWDQMIQRELNAAKVVIAVWSDLSVSAPWVKEEAMSGKHRGALVPVRIDEVEPPLGFGLIQFADLIDWNGDTQDKHWDFFIESIRATMEGRPVQGIEKPHRVKKRSFVPILSALLLAVVGGAGFLWFLMQEQSGPTLSDHATVSGPASDMKVSVGSPSAAEQDMFEKAQETRLKSDYQDFLRSFPQGFYAKRVREEILPLCTPEQRDVWKTQRTNNDLRGISDSKDNAENPVTFTDRDKACASATHNAEYDAKRYCNLVSQGENNRNTEVSVSKSECECKTVEADNTVWCLYDTTYACSWEFKSFQYVEVCG